MLLNFLCRMISSSLIITPGWNNIYIYICMNFFGAICFENYMFDHSASVQSCNMISEFHFFLGFPLDSAGSEYFPSE